MFCYPPIDFFEPLEVGCLLFVTLVMLQLWASYVSCLVDSFASLMCILFCEISCESFVSIASLIILRVMMVPLYVLLPPCGSGWHLLAWGVDLLVPHGWVEFYLHPLGFGSSFFMFEEDPEKIEDFLHVPELCIHPIMGLLEICILWIHCNVFDVLMYILQQCNMYLVPM